MERAIFFRFVAVRSIQKKSVAYSTKLLICCEMSYNLRKVTYSKLQGSHVVIVNTKLHIPHLRRELLVERPAIMNLLSEGLKKKLTVVTAPGGYSKTTALSQWVQQNGVPCAWVSLDPLDNDLTQFWKYGIAAIDSKRPNFAKAMNPCLSTLKSGTFEPFITAMIHEFSSFSDDW